MCICKFLYMFNQIYATLMKYNFLKSIKSRLTDGNIFFYFINQHFLHESLLDAYQTATS